jgi:uncharacterized membrane protein YuzA (DUF378 family)
MPSAIGALGAAICVSLVEGAWTWLLAAALSEVAGQIPPSPIFQGCALFAAWFSARTLELRQVSLVPRRRILVGAGIMVALMAGTMHSGLVLPTQLVFGRPSPDLRGAGIAVVLLTAYLWGRGLALARGIDRDRVGNHVAVSASGLIAVLIFLPLTSAVQRDGMLVVGISFLFGTAALTFLQIAGTESRKLTPFQWTALVGATSAVLSIVAAILTGAFTTIRFDLLPGVFGAIARWASPVTDAILLAGGHVAEYLAYVFRALREMFGTDPEAIRRATERAQQERPEFDPNEAIGSPPEIMTLFVAVFLSLVALGIMYWIYSTLIGHQRTRQGRSTRSRSRIAGDSPLSGIRSALGRLWRHGDDEGPVPSEGRAAIRHHYRRFQVLLARADLPRRVSQTPREYELTLANRLESSQRQLAEITDAYVLARYAPAEQELPDAERVGAAVDELRTALQTAEPSPEPDR